MNPFIDKDGERAKLERVVDVFLFLFLLSSSLGLFTRKEFGFSSKLH